jgi:glycosyltransferase involved in cell wall biosynthesis
MNCSIIVCTRNRASVLQRTLAELSGQDYPASRLEIIVVDNGSVDHTADVVRSFDESCRFPVTHLVEPVPGISRARNLGLARARGDILVFLDDDAFPERSDWISNLLQAYTDPSISAAGGDIRPLWPGGERPAWIHDLYLSPLGVSELDLPTMTARRYPYCLWGANISFRKKCLVRHNGFSTDLGRVGDTLISGEETELCLKLEKKDRKIVYVPNAAVHHLIDEKRVDPSWMMKRAFAQGMTEAIIDARHVPPAWRVLACFRRSANLVAHSVGAAVCGLLCRSKQRIFCQYNAIYSWSYLKHLLGKGYSEVVKGHE